MSAEPRIGSLFSGYGGLDQAVEAVTGGRTVWVSDVDSGANRILAHRYPDVPNHGDLTRIDWAAVEPVDVLTGGFPCQDVSHAGLRGGLRPDTRSGLWTSMAYAIDQLRPALVVAENVRGLLSADAHSDVEPCPWCVGDGGAGYPLRALGAVLGDLADLGYDAAWCGLRAADVGAPHGRFRVFVAAWPAADTADHGRVSLLPTPAVNGDRSGEMLLPGQVRKLAEQRLLPTPKASNNENRQSDRYAGERGNYHGLLHGTVQWGDYAVAIARWEHLTRPAPAPTMTSTKGTPQLSPAFLEWLMGLPAGWVTDVPGLSRAQQLKALGNGVVPQQAATALHHLIGLIP